jgi:hypothetical protein
MMINATKGNSMKKLEYKYLGLQKGAEGKLFRSYQDCETGGNFLVSMNQRVDERWEEFKKEWNEEVENFKKDDK